MSANVAFAAPVRHPLQGRPREALEAAPQYPRRVQIVTTRAQRRARPKLVYALGATGVIFAIFLAQLLITIALSGGAYTITDLQSSQQALGLTASSLNEKLETLGSSQNLQANALALGMVNSSQAAFLRLSNGSVLGTATAAGSASSTSAQNGSSDSVPNSLLTDIPLIKSTGAGHGDSNASNSPTNNSDSTQGGSSTASTGTVTPAAPPPPQNGDLPSPVTH